MRFSSPKGILTLFVGYALGIIGPAVAQQAVNRFEPIDLLDGRPWKPADPRDASKGRIVSLKGKDVVWDNVDKETGNAMFRVSRFDHSNCAVALPLGVPFSLLLEDRTGEGYAVFLDNARILSAAWHPADRPSATIQK